MNRKEAIECLEVHAEELKRRGFEDLHLRQVIEYLEEPITLTEFLGWEEGVEYEWRNEKYRIYDDILQCYDRNDDCWYDSVEEINDYLRLQQAKKVEKKLKAYHVKDEYSYNCLMKELEEQGYEWRFGGKPTKSEFWENYKHKTVIYCKGNKTITYTTSSDYENHEKDNYDLIEYHKEEPKFYAKRKGWELFDSYKEQYWNYHPDRKKLFTSSKLENYHYKTNMTKTKWNELGINDTNADFEEVEQ